MWDFWHAVVAYTGLSIASLAWKIHGAVQLVGIGQDSGEDSSASGLFVGGEPNDGLRLLNVLLSSNLTIGILINFATNVAILLYLLAKAIFFGPLVLQESQKLAERLINYVLFKVLFLMAVSRSEIYPGALWLPWFALLGFLKIFSGLARDRFERLCASPAASLWSHMRTMSALILVLACDLLCMRACIQTLLLKGAHLSSLLLLNFEAVIIALDTSQTLVQYSLHLAETFVEFPTGESMSCVPFCGMSSATWAERRGQLLFYLNLGCDLANLLLTLAHYAHIWWLHGLAFQIVDGVLLMNIRALAVAVFRRVRQVLKYRHAMKNLRTMFADATREDIQDYNDDCAICKEPMAVAKKLPCKHLFHLGCLSSWFDQGSAGSYSCPTCRFSLLGPVPKQTAGSAVTPTQGSHENGGPQEPIGVSPLADRPVVNDEFSVDMLASMRGTQLNARLNFGAGEGGRGRGSGNLNGFEENATGSQSWFWPFGHTGRVIDGVRGIGGVGGEGGVAGDGGVGGGGVGPYRSPITRQALSASGLRFRGHVGGASHSQFRSHSGSSGNDVSRLFEEDARLSSMASQVQEVLPHVPHSMVMQDLRRTNSVQLTVENLLGSFPFGS